MKTWNKFCVSAACSCSSFLSDSGSAVRRRRRIPDETASSFSIVSRSDLFIRYYRPNSIESSCNATSSVPNIGDAKIVVTFRVETSIRAQKTSNWNNPCFCPCAQDFTGIYEMYTLKPRVKEGLPTHGAFTGVLQHFLYLGIVTYCTLYKRSPVFEFLQYRTSCDLL